MPFKGSCKRLMTFCPARRGLVSIFAFIFSVLLTASWVGADDPKTSESGVRMLQDRGDRIVAVLPNRLIVVIQETRTSPVVSVRVSVKTGSIFEQEFVGAGISHYLEHLVAGGSTTTRTEAETGRILSDIGGQTNASTGLDRVNYFVHTTSAHAATAIELVSDWVANASITEHEFLREKQVINSEFAMGRGDPRRTLWRNTQQARFQLHPARHPTIGYLDEFNLITREQLTDFFERMYVPNNMIKVVVGDIDRHAVLDQIVEFWKDIPARPLPTIKFPIEPIREHVPTVEAQADVRAVRLRLAWPSTRSHAEHDYALHLLAGVLASGDASRLVRTIRDEQKLANTVSAYNTSFSWGEGFFGVDVELSRPAPGSPEAGQTLEERLKAVEQAVMAQLQSVIDEPVTEEELARAKRRVQVAVATSGQNVQGLASSLAWHVAAAGNPDFLQDYLEAVNKLTAADLQAAAREFIRPERTIRVVLRPLPPGEQAVEMVRPEEPELPDLKWEEVDLDNRVLIKQLEESLARERPARVQASTGEIVEHTLSNGLRVLIQPLSLVPAVSMHYFQLGGLLAEPAGQEGLANAMAFMQMRGTRSMNARQLAERLDELGASISTAGGYNTHSAQAGGLASDMAELFGLLGEVLMYPAFDEQEWTNAQRRILAGLDRRQDSWSGELFGHLRQKWYGDHPWAFEPAGRREAVASFTVEDLRRFHANNLGADRAVLAVVGDVDPQEVIRLAEKTLGGIPAKTPVQAKADLPPTPTAGATQVITNKQNTAAGVLVTGPLPTRMDDDYAAMAVTARLLARFPSGHLVEALRGEGHGLAYAVWAFQQTGIQPGHFVMAFNSLPEKSAEALRQTVLVHRNLLSRPVSAEELAQAKASVLTAEFLGNQSLSDLATQLALDELYGMGRDSGRAFLNRVNALTPEKLHAAVNRYLVNPKAILMIDRPLDEEVFQQAAQGGAEPLWAPPAVRSPEADEYAPATGMGPGNAATTSSVGG